MWHRTKVIVIIVRDCIVELPAVAFGGGLCASRPPPPPCVCTAPPWVIAHHRPPPQHSSDALLCPPPSVPPWVSALGHRRPPDPGHARDKDRPGRETARWPRFFPWRDTRDGCGDFSAPGMLARSSGSSGGRGGGGVIRWHRGYRWVVVLGDERAGLPLALGVGAYGFRDDCQTRLLSYCNFHIVSVSSKK